MLRSTILAVALLAAVLGPTRLAAQTHRDVIISQLDAAAAIKKPDGFRPAGDALPRDVVVGVLPAGGAVAFELSLTGGSTYFISGVCDGDCADLDLRVIDPDDGETVIEDIEDDDVPMLEFVAPRTGPYLLSVMMPDCSEDLCYFGYRVLKK
jgi:hypothetical protein